MGNGKNQQSHQDTTFAEALLGEMSDVSRVIFPADYNSLLAVLPSIYGSRGQIVCVVVAKRDRKNYFSAQLAQQLAQDGVVVLDEHAGQDAVLLIANGSYQLEQMVLAAQRLKQQGRGYKLLYLQEPGRLRQGRDEIEEKQCLSAKKIAELGLEKYGYRIALTHMRPEVFRGHLWHLFPQTDQSAVLGYINRGGTLNEFGMQFANKATWAHVLKAYAHIAKTELQVYLNQDELNAVLGKGDPLALYKTE